MDRTQQMYRLSTGTLIPASEVCEGCMAAQRKTAFPPRRSYGAAGRSFSALTPVMAGGRDITPAVTRRCSLCRKVVPLETLYQHLAEDHQSGEYGGD